MIFFDIDGTILNHDKAEELGSIDFFNLYVEDINYSKQEFIKKWNYLSVKYFNKYLSKELSFREQRRMRIRELFNYDLSGEQADEKFNGYLELYRNRWRVYDDVIPCLEFLKSNGYRLGVISNGDLSQQLEKLNNIGVKKYFNNIYASSEIGVSKPNPEIFLEACKQANAKVGEC
ncbi:HAD family hydrolase [Shouchella shacheensis]|uniref:HAD family hydrolase n=1 Tax=Shouchella shacheensis TaxID=1649580 RepID=UPI00073FCD8A|nr:HAD family hydrolase [Shouchella shacheensis]